MRPTWTEKGKDGGKEGRNGGHTTSSGVSLIGEEGWMKRRKEAVQAGRGKKEKNCQKKGKAKNDGKEGKGRGRIKEGKRDEGRRD
jgi:hypothetical protein